MSTPTEFGATRQVWFAPLASPTTLNSFLTRDDAGAKSGSTLARTVRLGDPIDLGPNSSWNQKTWEGGQDQRAWKDEAMYDSGELDVARKRGRARLHAGWESIYAANGTGHESFVFAPVGGDIHNLNESILVIGRQSRGGPYHVSEVYSYSPNSDTTTLWTALDLTYFCTAISTISDQSDLAQYSAAIGLNNGKFYTLNPGTGVWTPENTSTAAAPIHYDAIRPFGDSTYYGMAGQLWKRSFANGTVTHSKVSDVASESTVQGMCVHQNRLWFVGIRPGPYSTAYVSDGVTVTPAFRFPEDFFCWGAVSHYGSLYFVGNRRAPKPGANFATTSFVGVVWRYNGSSLTKLYEEGTGSDSQNHSIQGVTSWGPFVVWNRTGIPNVQSPGVMLYDAELDAISVGPTFDMDASSEGVFGDNLGVYGGQLVGSFYDYHTYPTKAFGNACLMRVRGTVENVRHRLKTQLTGTFGSAISFAAQPTILSRSITSSVYDGDIPNEKKTFLGLRLRCKLPGPNCSIIVKVLLNETTTETAVGTVSYDATNLNLRQVTFPLKGAGGDYLQAYSIQYRLYLTNSDATDDNSISAPVVDAVYLSWQPAPTKRRQWRVRAVCSDNQSRLDGSANPLTTSQSLAQYLEDAFGTQKPLYFWPQSTSTTAPVDTSGAVEVEVQDWNEQSYRLDSTGTQEAAEVSLTLVEVVP